MKTKGATIDHIQDLVWAVGDRLDGDDDTDRYVMEQALPARLHAPVLRLPTLALHLLAAVGDSPGELSIVGLAERAAKPKGTVSKNVQQLVVAGLLQRTAVPGNRKEIRLDLTADGLLVYRAHQALHDAMRERTREFLSRYTAADLEVVRRILDDLLRSDWRSPKIT